jgi:hypothetical protein
VGFSVQLHLVPDGVPPCFSRAITIYLSHSFPDQWISHDGLQHDRSPDLHPLGFCVWHHVKDLVYQQKVKTQGTLLNCILDTAEVM